MRYGFLPSQDAPAMNRLFYWILGNNLVANVTNFTVWFAVTFWVYLETSRCSRPA
jgi:DHA3 family multidrug efflux protein-like MFS transporter